MKNKSKLKANEEFGAESDASIDSKTNIKEPKANKFRFESYIARLSSIELKVAENEIWDFDTENVQQDKWYAEDALQDHQVISSESEVEDFEIPIEQQVKDQLSRTAFGDSLKYWEGTVRYAEFVDLVRILKPYRYSLVHIIQYLEFIIKELIQRINDCEHPETAEAISFLIGALAKDTRLELLPMLPSIFEALSIRLETPFNEVSITGKGGVGFYNEKIIQSVFSCTSTIFFYLSSYILKDLTKYLCIYSKWIYHSSSVIRHFSSESIAYALKKSKEQEIIKSLDMVFLFAFDQYTQNSSKTHLFNKWLSEVIVNVIFSIQGCISNQGGLVIRYLFRHLGFGLQIESKYLLNQQKSNQQEQGVISNFLTSINHQENVKNYNFQSCCDYEFRKSFHSLNLILVDILEQINSHISDQYNMQSFEEILSILLSIYFEIFQSKFTSFEIKVNNLIACIRMLAVACHFQVSKTNIHTESSAFKKKKFRFHYGILVLHLILASVRNEIFKGLFMEIKDGCFSLFSQLILSINDFLVKITNDATILKDSKVIHVLAYSDFKVFESNSFIKFIQSEFSFILLSPNEMYKESQSWIWLKSMLEISNNIQEIKSRTDFVILILDSISSILSVFNQNYDELEHFMKIIFSYQKILLEDLLKLNYPDYELMIKLLTNISKFINQEKSLYIQNLYLNQMDLLIPVLKNCKIVLSFQNLGLSDLYIVLELLACFSLKISNTNCSNLDSNFSQDLQSDLLKLYENLFKSKLDSNTSILETFESLESIQVFKWFCLVFSKFENDQINLKYLIPKIKNWMNSNTISSTCSKNFRDSISSTNNIISSIPLEYDSELISVLEILLDSSLKELENSELMKDLEMISLNWIINPLHQVRKKVCFFLFNFLSKQKSNPSIADLLQLLRLILNLQDTEANIENERIKIRQIQQICDFVQLKLKDSSSFESESDQFLFKFAIKSVLSQLYHKLSLIWKPCIEILAKLVKSIQENEAETRFESGIILEIILSSVFNQIYYNINQLRKGFKIQNEGSLLYTDEFTLIEWFCKLLAQIQFSDIDKYPDLIYFQVQLMYWLIQISFDFEGNQDQIASLKSESIIQQFCLNHGVQILDLLIVKGQIQVINYFIQVLEAILSNQKRSITTTQSSIILDFLLNKFLVECIPSLLYINHIELQTSLINIICNYGKDSEILVHYKSMFQGLISGSSKDGQILSLRSNLLTFSLSIEKEDIIKKQDRYKVIPIVIRVLLSKLGKDKEGFKKSNNNIVRLSKKGNKSLSSSTKRKVIISYLSELPKEEMSLLLSLIIEPLLEVNVILNDSKDDDLIQIQDEMELKEILESSQLDLKGYYKSFIINYMLSQDQIQNVCKFWKWHQIESYQENKLHFNDFGFVYYSQSLKFSQNESNHFSNSKRIKVSMKMINLFNSQYKVILRFLSYLDHILNFMSHTIKDHVHIIMVILVNVLYLNHSIMLNSSNLEYQQDFNEASLSLQQDEDLEAINAFDSSAVKKEEIQRKIAIHRVRVTCRQIYISISNILINYSEFSKGWNYLMHPISSILTSNLELNLRSLTNLKISSIMSLMINLSKDEALFDLYSNLFPQVLMKLSILFSQENVLCGITNGIIGLRLSTDSEILISTIIEMYLNLLFGGEERLALFIESFKRNIINNSKDLLIIDFSKEDEEMKELILNENQRKNKSQLSEYILISKKGYELISECIPSIINSLEKVMFRRNLKRLNNRMEIISFKELILLRILALLEMKKRIDGSLGNRNEDLSIIKIILLLLLSIMNKIHSNSEKVSDHNWSVLNLVLSMLKILDLNLIDSKNLRYNDIEDMYSKEKLIERIGSLIVLIDDELTKENGLKSLFLILISDIMSYLLLKTPHLKLRSTISEIFLFSEFSISGGAGAEAEAGEEKRSHLKLKVDSIEEYCKNSSRREKLKDEKFGSSFQGFNVKSLAVNKEGMVNFSELIPIVIYGLNRPSSNKRVVLDSTVNVDLQLDILKDLEDLFELETLNNLLDKDLRLLYPLVSQQLYLIGGIEGGDFSISSLSSRLIKKLIVSWCNLTKLLLESSEIEKNQEKNLKIIYILNLLLKLVIPYQEEVLRYSQNLQIKRNLLQLIDVIIVNFTPILDLFCLKMEISRQTLIEKFHLDLFPIITYTNIEDNEQVRLLEELTHIQKHRRARSLNFFARFSKFSFEKFAKNTSKDFQDSCIYLDKYQIHIPVSFYTIKTLGIPLALDALLQKGSGKETYSLSLGDNSLRSLEAFTLFFDWKYCIDITAYLIKLLKLLPQRKNYIIKAICSLLNSFDFQVNQLLNLNIRYLNYNKSIEYQKQGTENSNSKEEENSNFEEENLISKEEILKEQLSEMQSSIKQKLLPLLKSIMIDRSYKIDTKNDQIHQLIQSDSQSQKAKVVNSSSQNYGIIRSDIVLIIIRVLRCLPSKHFHSELPRLITQLIMALKSKDREIRRSSRSSIKSISKTLGVQYLPWIFNQMSSILTTGYQLPVLIFTVHSILHEISTSITELSANNSNSNFNTIILDDCIQIVGKMIIEELNRIADPDKRTTSLETIDTPMTGSVDEGKYVRSPQIIRILSTYVSFQGAEKLFEFLEDLLSGKIGDRDEASIISDSFSQKYLYWLKNLHFQFCIGFINNQNFGQNTKLKFSIYNLAKGIVLDKSMVKNEDIKILISSLDEQILNIFQDPLKLVDCIKSKNATTHYNSSSIHQSFKINRIERKEKYYQIQPGASIGKGTHQVIKREKGFESKVKSVVLSGSCLYLLNQLLKVISNNNLKEFISEDHNEQYPSMNLLLDHLLPLITINFANESSELASFSCKCLIRALFIESMETIKSLGILKFDHLGSLISKTALKMMEKSGINSINTSNNMAELISSSMKLFVALLIRPKSIQWFNELFFCKNQNQEIKKVSLFYTNILKQLHIAINDNRLRITSLQLLRQIILYGKDQVISCSDSLGSLYSLVDSILPLTVQYSSIEPKIVPLGCNIYVDLLVFYPMSEKSQKQRISILLENLPEYPTSEGRQALITAIHTLITRFPVKLLIESYNIMFLTGLTLALSTETENKPRSMIQEVIFDILLMYRNDNQARMKLIILVFKALGTLGNNLNIKCGLIILLEFILEFFISKREIISIKEISDFEDLIFSELNQLTSIFSTNGLQDENQQEVGSNNTNTNENVLYRLEYETICLLNLIMQGEFETFEIINSAWLSKEKLENRKTWSEFWNIFIIDNKNKIGLECEHLWVKSSILRMLTNLLKQCLVGIANSSKKNQKPFLIHFILNPKIFTKLFNKIIPLQFNSLLEFAPWLAPKVHACIQHLILLSNFLKEDWAPPRKLSEIDKLDDILQVSGNDQFNSQLGSSLYNFESTKSLKKIKILEENQVCDDDWLIIDKGQEESGRGDDEREIEEESPSLDIQMNNVIDNSSLTLSSSKYVTFTENDDTELVLDNYLLNQIPEAHQFDQENNKFGLKKEQEEKVEDNYQEIIVSEASTLVLEKKSTIKIEAYWWLIDRISCCNRFYQTRPGNFRTRLLLSLKSLYDMINYLPILIKDQDSNNNYWQNAKTLNSLKHATRALYQSSTMLNNQDFTEKGFQIYNITNFDWIQEIQKFGVFQIIAHTCLFAQRTVEVWDKVFNEIGESKILLNCLSQARKTVITNRMDRKAKLRLDTIRNPEIAYKRKKAIRERVQLSRKRKLRLKIENRKLNKL